VRVLRSSATVVAVFALAAGASAAYTVRPGDTLTGIASRHGVTVSELARTNGISNPNLVQIGRSLEIPARPGAGGYPLALRRAPDRLSLVPHFRWWAAANNIPADLLMAMTWLESGWQNSIVSPKGAVGIGQLMPTTTEFIRSELIGVPTLDPRVPEQNIRLSARYLRWLLARANGDVRRALATYYQGPRSVETIGMYRDTVLYVDGVLALRKYFA
jgi:soluble lytic murein transglycosylase-like protein